MQNTDRTRSLLIAMTPSPHRRFGAVLSVPVLAVLILVLWSASVAAADQAVAISDFAFTPKTVSVKAGETVTWTNTATRDHTVTADDGSFDSGDLSQGDSFANVFTEAGTYGYHCTIHPVQMTGTITVGATQTTPIPSGSPVPTPPPGTLPPSFFASAIPPTESPVVTPIASHAPADDAAASGSAPMFLIIAALVAAAVTTGLIIRNRRRPPVG